MRKLFEIGGAVATVVLIVFGVASIVMGVNGRNTVQDSLKQEQIVGTPDMTHDRDRGRGEEGRPAGIDQAADRRHRRQADRHRRRGHAPSRRTCGFTRSRRPAASPTAQLPRYATADGKGTNDPTKALTSERPAGRQPGPRNVWVTETALSTALNASYLAENVALFGIVVGVALLLTGIGFGVLVVGGSLRGRENVLQSFGKRKPETTGTHAIPVA